jgi:hypothetical protein
MSPHSPVDLHLHSTASDGMLDPAALVAHVAAHGVKLMALTDHDTVAGVDAAAAAAGVLDLAFVAGVEVSASWRGRSIHVLGLAIDPASPVLARALAEQQARREARAERIAARLDAAHPEARRSWLSAPPAACRPAPTLRANWSRSAWPPTWAPPSTAGSGADGRDTSAATGPGWPRRRRGSSMPAARR